MCREELRIAPLRSEWSKSRKVCEQNILSELRLVGVRKGTAARQPVKQEMMREWNTEERLGATRENLVRGATLIGKKQWTVRPYTTSRAADSRPISQIKS